jgi:hypothetical protein
MTRFSRRHYRSVSPPADTPREICDRLIRTEASRLAKVDRERDFPRVTPDNVEAVLDYQDARYVHHSQALATNLVQLALKKLGMLMCRHAFVLVQHRSRLFLRCDSCGAESQGFTVGDIPETRR